MPDFLAKHTVYCSIFLKFKSSDMHQLNHLRPKILFLGFILFSSIAILSCKSKEEKTEEVKVIEVIDTTKKSTVIDTTDERTDQKPPIRTGN